MATTVTTSTFNQYDAQLATLYPVVGDWNGDGIDTLGTKQMAGATWALTNVNSGSPTTSVTFDFG